MLTFLALVVGCAGIVWIINRKLTKHVPTSVLTLTNKVEKTTTTAVKEVLDVNNDNKITIADAKAAVKKVKNTAEKVATKVKKPRTKKPKK